MRRREFIAGLGWALSARPAWAQQRSRPARIGVLTLASQKSLETRLAAFREGLRQLGYIEGENIIIEWRAADGDTERLPGLASELVRLDLDLVVAVATPSALAVKRMTATTPIVGSAMGDPIEDGLVASLAKPAGNVTGTAFLGPELVPKRLELLKELLPAVSRIAVLRHPSASASAP
jgi:putative ABC transport system substrate-binding protein